MKRYTVTKDKNSAITNDANYWLEAPCHIVGLLKLYCPDQLGNCHYRQRSKVFLNGRQTVLPMHSTELKKGTVEAIKKQLGLK